MSTLCLDNFMLIFSLFHKLYIEKEKKIDDLKIFFYV